VRRAALLLLLATACSAENTRVRDARDSFYAAVSRFDQAAVRSAVTPGYISVDRGRFFPVDSLISDMTLLEAESLSVQFAFVDSTTQVDPPLGWIIYHSRRVLTGARYSDTTYATESAMFRREGNGWRLVVLHRTPVASGAEFFSPPTAASPPTAPAPAAQPRTARPRAAPQSPPAGR
jgi:hypothetical protein